MDLSGTRFQRDASAQQLSKAVSEFGGCVVENFLSQDELEGLRAEFQTVLETSPPGVRVHAQEPHVLAKAAAADQLPADMFPQTKSAVFGRGLRAVSEDYYQTAALSFPSKLFFVRSVGRENEVVTKLPYLLHWDRHQFLKFGIYLTDVDEACGPTIVVPGGIEKSRDQRLEILKGRLPVKGENVVPLGEGREIALTGPAGSLVIFDTDAPHRAGQLEAGRERWMLRIDTESLANQALYASESAAPTKPHFAARMLTRLGIR